MLPLEILLSSIDIGVDRVGSRLPLQGRCACLRVGLGFHLLHEHGQLMDVSDGDVPLSLFFWLKLFKLIIIMIF